MKRYLIYDNDNGVGAYQLEEDEDAIAFAENLLWELDDDPNSDEVNIFLLTVDNPADVEMMPNVIRIWEDEWENWKA